MKHTMVRACLAFAVVTAAAVGVAPSHATTVDGWVVIGTGDIAGVGVDALDAVYAAIELATDAVANKVCTPKSKSLSPGALSWTLWENENTGAIAFEWHGPGSASVSGECAETLNMLVHVTDYGSSGPEDGTPGFGSDSSGDPLSAASEAHTFVVYYDPARLYFRGNSVVEVKVTATYYNKKAKSWLPLGCRMTHTAITPWPNGPEGTTGPAEDCG